MRKIKRIAISLLAGACVLTAAAGVAACGEEDTLNVQSGTSTTLITDKAPTELTAENAIYAFLQKQTELQSYKITAKGTAIADFMGYKQEILNITYKNGEDYLNQAQSDSALVSMKHQSFSKGGKVVYRDSFDGEMSVADKDTYKQTYGFTADDVTLGGYIINGKTLRYATLEKTDGDSLTYYMRLAGDTSLESGATTESSTAAIRVQAKAYGSLDNLPTFSDIDIRLTFKTDWTPVSYTSTCSYDCKKMFDMNVSQTLTCTYSEVNQNVAIPDVVQFNQKLGSTPSEVHPGSGEEDPLMQIAAAFTNTLDENNTLSIPVSLGLNAFGAPLTLEGGLALKLRREALEKSDLSDAFSLRLDLDLSGVPLLSAAADTLTVRTADGMLLLMLNNRENGQDHFLLTYAASLEGLAASTDLSLGGLRESIAALVTVQKTGAGYTLTLKDEVLGELNKSYQGLIGLLGEKLGDTQGYISSVLGTTFTAAKLDLALGGSGGAQTLSGIALNVTGTPAENTTLGEKLDVSIDTKLLGGNIAEPLAGELQFRLDPAAILSGNLLKAVKAALHLDLSPAAGLFGTLQSLNIEQIPAFIPDSKSLDVYYTGDGTLTLAFNNENGLLIGVIDADLSGLSEKIPSEDGGEFPFAIDLCENGVGLILKESAVERLAEAYNGLVENLIAQATAALDEFMGKLAAGTLRGYLGANITGLQLVLGKDNGDLRLGLAVHGILQNAETEDRILGVTLTHREALTAAERDKLISDEAAKAAHEKLVKPTAYVEELQTLIDYIDVTESGKDGYIAKVNALKARIDAEPDEVKALISNRSYLEEKTLFMSQEGAKPLLLLLQDAYLGQVNSFKNKMAPGDDYASFSESQWTALNNVFDKGSAITLSDFKSVATPAVKDCKAMLDAIGQAHITAYTAARDAWEDAAARAFLEELNGLAAELESKSTTEDLQGLLTAFKAVQTEYQKIAEGKRAIVNDAYDAYVLAIGQKNFEAIEKEYAALQSAVGASDGETMETLISLLVRFNDVAKWHTGWDYWNSTAKAVAWGSALDTSGLLSQLTKEDSKAALTASVNAAKKLRTETAGKIVEKFSELLKGELTALKTQADRCKQVTGNKTTYDFAQMGSDAAALNGTLAKMQALRFLFTNTTLSDEAKTNFFGGDADLQTFAMTDLKNCEKALATYIKSLPSA